MDKALADLIRISNTTGKDTKLVQGGGGNTSVKTPGKKFMYIKASGTSLRDMDAKNGWRKVNLDAVLSIVKDKSLAELQPDKRELQVVRRLFAACDDKVTSQVKPSTEAHLHAFLDNCVIHLHPDAVGAYINAKNGKKFLQRIFKNEKLPPLWVPYAEPGFCLARKISNLISGYQSYYGEKPEILFLQKHGLIVSASKPDDSLRLVRRVIRLCQAGLRPQRKVRLKKPDVKVVSDIKLSLRESIFKATGQYVSVEFLLNDVIASFMAKRNAPQLLRAVITPAELIDANGPPLWIQKFEPHKITGSLKAQLKRRKKPSRAFLVKNFGLFVTGSKKKIEVIKQVVTSSLFIRANASYMGGVNGLSSAQQDFIIKWEAAAH